jgi:hypothetical protein
MPERSRGRLKGSKKEPKGKRMNNQNPWTSRFVYNAPYVALETQDMRPDSTQDMNRKLDKLDNCWHRLGIVWAASGLHASTTEPSPHPKSRNLSLANKTPLTNFRFRPFTGWSCYSLSEFIWVHNGTCTLEWNRQIYNHCGFWPREQSFLSITD